MRPARRLAPDAPVPLGGCCSAPRESVGCPSGAGARPGPHSGHRFARLPVVWIRGYIGNKWGECKPKREIKPNLFSVRSEPCPGATKSRAGRERVLRLARPPDGASPAAARDAANVTNGGVGAAGLAAGPLSRPLPASGERGIAAVRLLRFSLLRLRGRAGVGGRQERNCCCCLPLLPSRWAGGVGRGSCGLRAARQVLARRA